ncbi:hypothetical protein [Allorhizocola rhizosphaerae]|uniref:hypothetical protein n=1 Tax=Allorhizocola rhizosphaerae TaxID=1872709 RepID=UPI000E3B9EAB|nr:hypothetical protein [Allorhizocola rhizosphaerae]
MTERTATLLNPQEGEPTVHDSHIGGPLLWPADDPWPACEHPHMVHHETLLPSRDISFGKLRKQFYFFTGTSSKPDGTYAVHYEPTEHEPNPLVSIAQLYARDIPDLVCPPGTDMLQVLWCPNEHELDDGWSPFVVLRWRDSASVMEVLEDPPSPHAVDEDWSLMPKPCALHPTRTTDRAWADGEDNEGRIAPGWKVGGYAKWGVTDELPTDCDGCGGPTELLITIDSEESDETDIEVGRYGALRLFVCRRCEGMPFRFDIQ